jgi:DNA repair exonuclease SbcCD ATPase subunit
MIETLKLIDFGKFKNRDFNFKAVTLFLGENEAGKSTIFDALLDKICSPKGTSVDGKRLKNRYGEARLAEITGDSPQISESDVLNLYAVKSGPINLEIDKNSEAMNTVKASLFSGGIDPKTVAEGLQKTVSARGKDSLSERKKQAANEIDRLEKALDEDNNARRKYFQKEAEISEQDARLKEAEKEIAELEKAAAADEKARKDQYRLKEEKQFNETLSALFDFQRKKEALEKYALYTKEAFEKIKNLEREETERKNEFAALVKNLEEAVREAEGKAREKSAQEHTKSKAFDEKILAGSLKDRVYPKEKLIEEKTVTEINKVFIVLSVLFICAGAILFFITPPQLQIFFPISGVVLAVLFLILSIKKQKVIDSSRFDAELESVRERWRKETNREIPGTYEGVLLALENTSKDAEFAEENYRRISEETDRAEEKKRSLEGQKVSLDNRYTKAKRAFTDALGSTTVRDVMEYAGLLSKKDSETESYAEAGRKIQSSMKEYNAASENALEDILRLKIKEIHETVTADELSENEFRRLESRLNETRKKLANLQRLKEGYISSVSGDRGETNAVFRELPRKIADEEKSIAKAEAKLRELKTEIRANEIAGNIFSALSEDTDRMLRELSDEIEKTFSAFTSDDNTGADGRDVGLKSFSISGDNVTVSDELGASRELVNLSAGTRDAFILAARLILALKSQKDAKNAPIIFDESFTSLDRKRTERALKILKEFRGKTGWQIILLTKDLDLEDQAQAVFGSDLAIYRLTI